MNLDRYCWHLLWAAILTPPMLTFVAGYLVGRMR
jgi:hypothetical protein